MDGYGLVTSNSIMSTGNRFEQSRTFFRTKKFRLPAVAVANICQNGAPE